MGSLPAIPTMGNGIFFEVDACEVLKPDESSTVTSTFASSSSNAAIPPAAGPGPEGEQPLAMSPIPSPVRCNPKDTILLKYWFGEGIVEDLT